MKTPSIAIVLLLYGFTTVQGQSNNYPTNFLQRLQNSALPAPAAYQAVQSGAHQRVWQRTTYETNSHGKLISSVHSYIELATGLNYLNNGQWVPALEKIVLLANGTAAATNGQHQARFPGDIYGGAIETVTPNGVSLKSRPLGLFYDDGNNTVMIAQLTNAVGYIVGSNQVIYSNAFAGFRADLRYTYTKAGIEQDVIIRAQPPAPEDYNLNPLQSQLQLLTEFINSPMPTLSSSAMLQQSGMTVPDQSVGFGNMRMDQGRAYLMGKKAHDPSVSVGKQWLNLNGRQILVEAVPVMAIADDLLALPQLSYARPVGRETLMAGGKYWLPEQRLVQATPGKNLILLAKNTVSDQGFVLDFQLMNSSTNNFTFQGDTTYLVSGPCILNGTITIEGGAVIKYVDGNLNSSQLNDLQINGPVNCQTGPYHPAVFTSMDDDTVGETVSGSSGMPTTLTYAAYLMGGGTTLHDLRFKYATAGVLCTSGILNLRDCQFLDCIGGVVAYSSSTVRLQNVLVAQCHYALACMSGSTTFIGEQVTADVTANIVGDYSGYGGVHYVAPAGVYVTNSIIMGSCQWGTANIHTNAVMVNPAGTVFQSDSASGSGNYYLADNSPCRGRGTNTIDPTLLAELATKTTYPPLGLGGFSVDTILSPQIPRDTNASPDLGFHYDPIDYQAAYATVDSGVTLMLTNGVVVSGYMYYPPFVISDNATLMGQGAALQHNRLIWANTVQEGGNYDALNGGYFMWTGVNFTNCLRFTDFMSLGGICQFFDNVSPGLITMNDCRFSCGTIPGWDAGYIVLANNLLERVNFISGIDGGYSENLLSQNLFYGGSAAFNNWWISLANNAFDHTDINGQYVNYSCYNNAFIATTGYSSVDNGNLTLTNFSYAPGPLGNYYQASTNLIDRGGATADQVGLYHFTTRTNQVKETNSIVDIGYHYVAVNAYGNPIDTDGDGLADYLEDANGNGVFDAGDLGDWLVSRFNGLSRTFGLQVFTPLKP